LLANLIDLEIQTNKNILIEIICISFYKNNQELRIITKIKLNFTSPFEKIIEFFPNSFDFLVLFGDEKNYCLKFKAKEILLFNIKFK
jgi:hypothetical protein